MRNQADRSLPENVASILEEAKRRESGYDWLAAAKSYQEALDLIPERDSSSLAEIYENRAYALYRAAFQAENPDEFRQRTRKSIGNYEKASELLGSLTDAGNKAGRLRCQAMIAYLASWLASEAPEKKRLLDGSWRVAREALKAFLEAGEALEYGKTYNQLVISIRLLDDLESNAPTRENILREALEHGEDAIKFFSTFRDPSNLTIALVNTASCLQKLGEYLVDIDQKRRYFERSLDYWKKAKELSEEKALLELSNFHIGDLSSILEGAATDKILNFEKALELARNTKDKLTIGGSLDWLAFHEFFAVDSTEDSDEMLELARKSLKFVEEARDHYSRISFTSPRHGVLWTGEPHTEYYWKLALLETSPTRRRDMLERALEAVPILLKRAEDSGFPGVTAHAHHVTSKVMASLARMETASEEKRRLLEEALKHRRESTMLDEQLNPFKYFGQGVHQNYLADIKSELADLARDAETRNNMLQEAIRDKEAGIKLCLKEVQLMQTVGRAKTYSYPALGKWASEHGSLLSRLHELTNDKADLSKAIEAFREAAEFFQNRNLNSRMAECYWKTAELYDDLGEHLKAAESFLMASNNYNLAAQRIIRLQSFYQDHARYMEAWGEIEKAKHHHERQDYGSAKEFYERAASLHKSTKEWSFLTPNYSALAQVENGEDLSRRERGQEAIQAFHQANRLFNETRTMLQAELSKIENVDKKQMVTSLVKGTDLRRDYCMGRIALEEAKLFDRKGDYSSSSQQYGHAADTFEKVAQSIELERGRMEVKLIATVSRAWQMMIKAEAEASPELYMEASTLFEEVKELSPNEKAKSLALGHSRFCRALDAGTRFADIGDPSLHATAIQHLESASKYYLKAGFRDASEYAEATELLFDAYLHMDEAKREKDHEKKAKLYAMTEKVLQASADSFLKAKHPAKRELVLRLMEKVKKERELALSLTEVLHAPALVSATVAFSAPMPTRERAVGLERFEHADIQARLITRQKSLQVGEDLDLEIEFVNAGKGPAQLVKVEELVPEGFELTGKPEPYRVEDSYLNMKGRRLDPLKTEEVKLVLKPKVQGQFTLKPRVLYIDESGKYKSHEPEPIEITVRELGISGWLKGR